MMSSLVEEYNEAIRMILDAQGERDAARARVAELEALLRNGAGDDSPEWQQAQAIDDAVRTHGEPPPITLTLKLDGDA